MSQFWVGFFTSGMLAALMITAVIKLPSLRPPPQPPMPKGQKENKKAMEDLAAGRPVVTSVMFSRKTKRGNRRENP